MNFAPFSFPFPNQEGRLFCQYRLRRFLTGFLNFGKAIAFSACVLSKTISEWASERLRRAIDTSDELGPLLARLFNSWFLLFTFTDHFRFVRACHFAAKYLSELFNLSRSTLNTKHFFFKHIRYNGRIMSHISYLWEENKSKSNRKKNLPFYHLLWWWGKVFDGPKINVNLTPNISRWCIQSFSLFTYENVNKEKCARVWDVPKM